MRSDNQQHERFFELLEPELPRLQAFCQKLAGNPDSGNDLMQDSLYDAWKGFGKLRQTTSFKPWLYQITVYRYRTNIRKFKKWTNTMVPLTDDLVDNTQSEQHAVCDRLNFVMGSLSTSDRALVTLHELEGWSYSELATMFGSNEGALRTKLARCRDRMRKALMIYMKRKSKDSPTIEVSREWIVVKQKRS